MMTAFILWDDWQKLTSDQRMLVEMYGGDFRRSLDGLEFEIDQSRMDEIATLGYRA